MNSLFTTESDLCFYQVLLGWKCCLEHSLRINLIRVTSNDMVSPDTMKSSVLLLNDCVTANSKAGFSLWRSSSREAWGFAAHCTCPVLGLTAKALTSVTWSEGTITKLVSRGPLNNH